MNNRPNRIDPTDATPRVERWLVGLVLLWVVSAFVFATSLLPCAQAANVYVSASQDMNGCVAQYQIKPNGTLQLLSEIHIGAWPMGLAVAPDGATAYLFDPVAPFIGQYRRVAGALQAMNPFPAAVHASADQLLLRRFGEVTYAYALDRDTALVRALVLDDAGQLHETDTVPSGAAYGISLLAVHPRRPYAYLAGEHAYGGRIDQFELNPATGAMGWLYSAFYAWGVAKPLAMLIHPQLEMLYLSSTDSSAITRYVIDATGKLVRQGGETQLPWVPSAMALGKDGRFLYAGANSGGEIAWWRIAPLTGVLIAAGTHQIEHAGPLSAIAVDPHFPWLYVLDADNRQLHQFVLALDGSLHAMDPPSVQVPPGAQAVDITAAP